MLRYFYNITAGNTEPLGILLSDQAQHLDAHVHLYASSVTEKKISWGSQIPQ